MQNKPPEIRILPDDVANRIAAGEVIERPASAVKELVENALDAGATRIEIEFKHGGKTFLKVSDNGCGMTREQALMSLEPHATSKIKTADDIFKISSFGFRGEAVPSIASVSKFTMRTRPHEAIAGTQIEVYAGEIKDVRECGMPAGTEMIAENIFCSVPARRKFLKSDNVEASHIIKLCRLYALSLPNISITLIENSRVVFRSESGLDILARIARVSGLGTDISEKLIEIEPFTNGVYSISGALVSPTESFTTSRNICAFINSRPIDSRTVYSALKEAYSGRLEKGRYAGAYIFLEIPPEDVDVNVHPAKREVRLKNEFAVRDFLVTAFLKTLEKFDAGKMQSSFSAQITEEQSTFSIKEETPLTSPQKESLPEIPTRFIPAVLPPAPKISEQRGIISTEYKEDFKNTLNLIEKKLQKTPTKESPQSSQNQTVKGWKFLAITKRKYALFETEKALVVMSIANAVRRIDYNKIKEKSQVTSQGILIPITLKFERADAEYFELNKNSFESCGFEIEDFGTNCYRIYAAPDWLELSQVEQFIRDFVELANEESAGVKKHSLDISTFAKLATKRIRISESTLSENGATSLLKELLNTQDNLTSPDGSPIFKEFPFTSLF